MGTTTLSIARAARETTKVEFIDEEDRFVRLGAEFIVLVLAVVLVAVVLVARVVVVAVVEGVFMFGL